MRGIASLLLVGTFGLAVCITMAVLIAGQESPTTPTVSLETPRKDQVRDTVDVPPRPVDTVTKPKGPKRMPVGGQDGYFVVIEIDGSSYLEAPDGSQTKLVDAGPALILPREITLGSPPRKPIGQLVVCDDGVVDIPKGAIVTYVGKDKVVTHDEGGSTTYYTDGKTERRDRSARKEALPKTQR